MSFRTRTGLTALWAMLLLANVEIAQACPVCDTGTGRQVRAGLFGPDFGRNLLATAAPFPVFLGVAALTYYGPPRLPSLRRRKKG